MTRNTTRRRFAKGIGTATLLGATGVAAGSNHATLQIQVPPQAPAGSTVTGQVVLTEVPDAGLHLTNFTVETDPDGAELVAGQYAHDYDRTGSVHVESDGSAVDYNFDDGDSDAVAPGSSDAVLGTFQLQAGAPGDVSLSLSDVSVRKDDDDLSEVGVATSGATLTVAPGPTPTVATVVDGPTYVGQETTARLVIDRVPANFQLMEFDVVTDPQVLEIVDASYAQDFDNTVSPEINDYGDRVSFDATVHDELSVGQTNVPLVEVTLEAKSVGDTPVDPNNATFVVDAETADFDHQVGVGQVVRPESVGYGAPTDPDGDGLYEDLNANGRKDTGDVVELFQNRDAPAVQNHAAAYDFNRNGEIDLADVNTLFQEL